MHHNNLDWTSILPLELIFTIFEYLELINLARLEIVSKDLKFKINDSAFIPKFWSSKVSSGLKYNQTYQWQQLGLRLKETIKFANLKNIEEFITDKYDMLAISALQQMDIGKEDLNKILYRAAEKGQLQCIKWLFNNRKVDVYFKQKDGSTLLYIAAQNGHTDVITYLLVKQKAKLNTLFEKCELDIAAENNQVYTVKTLLKYGSIPCNLGKFNSIAMYLAAQRGYFEIVKILLDHGISADQCRYKGFTCLYTAARNGHLEIVKLLTEYGADPNNRDGDGSTPIYIATQHGHIQVVEYLASLSNTIVDGPLTWFLNSYSPLYISAQNGYHRITEILCQKGAQVNNVGANTATALYTASQNGHDKVVEVLLRHGASTEITYGLGCTPLYIASQKGYLKCVEHLIKYGAFIDVQTQKGATPLYVACHMNNIDIVKLLLEHQANPNITFLSNNYSPLHISILEGNMDAAKLLLNDSRTNINIKTFCGKYPDQMGYKGSVLPIKIQIRQQRRNGQYTV